MIETKAASHTRRHSGARPQAASPESIRRGARVMDSGSAASAASRNDENVQPLGTATAGVYIYEISHMIGASAGRLR